MNHEQQIPPAVDALVEAMLMSHGQLTFLVDHMVRHAAMDENAESIPDVIRRLFAETLVDLADDHGSDDVATAAQMLAAAVDLLAENIFIVPTNRRDRRRGRRRRGH